MVLQSKESNSTSGNYWYAYRVISNNIGNWLTNMKKQPKLPGLAPIGREIGGDMRCGYARIMEVIRMSYHRNPDQGDVFFFMSKDERSVRMVMYEKQAFNINTCTFTKGYRFMKIRFKEEKNVYQVDWKDIVTILESPVVKEIRVNEKNS